MTAPRVSIGLLFLLCLGCGHEAPAPSIAPPSIAPPSIATAPPSTALAAAPSVAACREATPEERVAIATAEAFVREQGYTDAPATAAELVPESIERGPGRDERLAFRHGSVEPRALGVFDHADAGVITVVFTHARGYLARIYPPDEIDAQLAVHGRGLVVPAEGAPHFVHQDALLDHVQRICAE